MMRGLTLMAVLVALAMPAAATPLMVKADDCTVITAHVPSDDVA